MSRGQRSDHRQSLKRAPAQVGERPGLHRLQKVIAHAGIASRRAAEELIIEGRVSVNGRVERQLGTKVDPAKDVVVVDGRTLQRRGEPTRTIKLFKPYGVLTTFTDPHGRPTLSSLIQTSERVYAAGRLDMDSEGLLLLTNDGELAHRITHPRYEHPKEYLVLVEGVPTEAVLRDLRKGVEFGGKPTAPARVERLPKPPNGLPERPLRDDVRKTWLRIVLHEGRKRQIRHMTAAVGLPTLRLLRVAVGPIKLGELQPGQWRDLSWQESRDLWQAVGGSRSQRESRVE